ncbi:hypothetical protein OIU84_017448 [Salix udensis]|uniref:Uncharacterized protein n=1 Tax=Salix udensis TaxID=889485 RepID=A0AAD6L1Z4_9ROSI|nr:hypothetical protein OIU84_017448 [Salix udensis]
MNAIKECTQRSNKIETTVGFFSDMFNQQPFHFHRFKNKYKLRKQIDYGKLIRHDIMYELNFCDCYVHTVLLC